MSQDNNRSPQEEIQTELTLCQKRILAINWNIPEPFFG